MGRRKGVSDEAVELIFILVELNWKIGALVSLLSAFLTYKAYHFVNTLINETETTIITGLIEKVSIALYLLPLMLLAFTIVFISSSYRSYIKGNSI